MILKERFFGNIDDEVILDVAMKSARFAEENCLDDMKFEYDVCKVSIYPKRDKWYLLQIWEYRDPFVYEYNYNIETGVLEFSGSREFE